MKYCMDLIPKIIYSFNAEHGTISNLGIMYRERKSMLLRYVGFTNSDKANERLKSFLNKYLMCLKG